MGKFLQEKAERTHKVHLNSGRYISAIESIVENPEWAFIYAPGAGSNIEDPFALSAAEKLAVHGIALIRFQFPFSERGSRSPDAEAVLLESWESIVNSFNDAAPRIVIGGRSLGGRIASSLIAKGQIVDALALFAYPLHPPGLPDRKRTDHFSTISIPTFFCSGTKDAFGSPAELESASSIITGSSLNLMEGADHGFRAGKLRAQAEVWDEAIGLFIAWLKQLSI